MKNKDFRNVIDVVYTRMRELTESKGEEYKGATDNQFSNFERGAVDTGMTREQVLLVYLSKHLDAIKTWVRDSAASNERQRSEPIEGRIDDAILYLILLRAMVPSALPAFFNQSPEEVTVSYYGPSAEQVALSMATKPYEVKPKVIELTDAEVQSGLDRVRWAEGLIRQLPEDHDGRNSWLLNFGTNEAKYKHESQPDPRPRYSKVCPVDFSTGVTTAGQASNQAKKTFESRLDPADTCNCAGCQAARGFAERKAAEAAKPYEAKSDPLKDEDFCQCERCSELRARIADQIKDGVKEFLGVPPGLSKWIHKHWPDIKVHTISREKFREAMDDPLQALQILLHGVGKTAGEYAEDRFRK